MNLFKTKLGRSMCAAFAAVLSLLILITTLSAARLNGLGQTTNRITVQEWRKHSLAQALADVAKESEIAAFELLIADSPDAIAALRDRIEANGREANRLLGAIEPLLYSPASREIVERLSTLQKVFISSFEQVVAQAEAGEREHVATILAVQTGRVRTLYLDKVKELTHLMGREIEGAGREAQALVTSGLQWIFALGSIATLVAVALSLLMTRRVLRQVGGDPETAVAVAARIAAGDFSVEVDRGLARDGSIMAALGIMSDKLRVITSQIKSNAFALSAAAQELSSAAGEARDKAEVQRKATASMLDLVKSLSGDAERIADQSGEARCVAENASKLADQGKQVALDTGSEMSKVVELVKATALSMARLDERSLRIGTMVTAIHEIAEQTNLLALNAAIEAARAGESGRGFAVVADEVRQLADRTNKATSEISTSSAETSREIGQAVGCVEQGTEQVEYGRSLVERTGVSMSEIENRFASVARMIDSIAEATGAQRRGAESIRSHVATVSGISEQNTAAVECLQVLANNLLELAGSLDESVAFIKTT